MPEIADEAADTVSRLRVIAERHGRTLGQVVWLPEMARLGRGETPRNFISAVAERAPNVDFALNVTPFPTHKVAPAVEPEFTEGDRGALIDLRCALKGRPGPDGAPPKDPAEIDWSHPSLAGLDEALKGLSTPQRSTRR